MTTSRLTVLGLDVAIDGHRILEGVSLHAGSGRLVGIIGPNGSGKSTLIRCMSRALSSQAGTIRLEGREIAHYGRKELARTLSVVPQETSRTFDFSVEDVVMMGRYAHQTVFSSISADDREACRCAMATVGVTGMGDRRISTLSGGEWQRVLIARTLSQESGIILLDEPTSHLDASHQVMILAAFQALVRDGATVIGVFHDLNLAAHFCDEILVLSAGRVATCGPPSDTITRETLRAVFALDAIVANHPCTGRPVVLPLSAPIAPAGSGKRVHVICGGGSGGWLLQALVATGCTITTGVLAVNDSDYLVAHNLGLFCITEPPFSPLSETSFAALLEAFSRSDLVILTEMPVGPGNLGNLSALAANEEGPPILFVNGNGDGNSPVMDFTNGEATALLEQLRRSGRLCPLTPEEVVRRCADLPGGTG